MPMSFDGLAANTSGWSIGPRARGTGSIGCAARTQYSLPTGHYATATAEHREPYESRGSRTVLGAPEGESPSGDSSARISIAAALMESESVINIPLVGWCRQRLPQRQRMVTVWQ